MNPLVLIAPLAIGVAGTLDYRRFVKQRKAVFNSFSEADTKYGKVKYVDIGPKDGPVILFSTGGGAGIDLVEMFDWLVNAGYRMIAVNRPGYYDLPVDAVDSIEGHAAIYHEVITYLGVKEVNVFGVSMGGLSSLYYAQSYPTKSMVLWCPVTGEYHPNQEAVNSPLGKLIMSDKAKDMISWLTTRSVNLFPKAIVASLLNAEAKLDKREIEEIAKSVVQDDDEKRRLIQFVHSLAPMSQIYPGMMDELEKAAQEHHFDWSKIDIPVLAYASPVDKDVSQDHFDRLSTNLVNGEVRFVRAGGHFVWWGSEGEEVREETLNFFDRVNK
mgnify:FL=1